MKLTISFLHLDHTPALDERIQEKTERLKKYFGNRAHVKWSCYVKNNLHYAELAVSGPSIEFHATAYSDNLYKTLDMVIEKIEKQIRKRKEKVKNKLHRKEHHLMLIKSGEASSKPSDYDAWEDDDWENAA